MLAETALAGKREGFSVKTDPEGKDGKQKGQQKGWHADAAGHDVYGIKKPVLGSNTDEFHTAHVFSVKKRIPAVPLLEHLFPHFRRTLKTKHKVQAQHHCHSSSKNEAPLFKSTFFHA